MKPNFMIIGAARSGTTSLYLYLEQHPEIYFSDVKELNFFSNEKYWKKGIAWYESRFKPKGPNISCIGEASTSYTRAPLKKDTPRRIYDYNPDIKLIYLVRNPIDRLVSHYLHRVQAGQEARELVDIVENVENETFAWQSLYYYQLQKYLDYFKKEQIYVASMDQLKEQPDAVVKSVFDFLGARPDIDIEKTGTVHNSNKNTTKKSELGAVVMKLYRDHLQQKPIPYQIKKVAKKFGEIGATRIEKPTLSESSYIKLCSFYREDSRKLEEQFGIDTSAWFENI